MSAAMQGCCVAGCGNKPDRASDLTFYRIPVGSHPFQRRRRELWIRAVPVGPGVRWTEELAKHSRICSAHFISGKASVDPDSPDFVPSVFGPSEQPPKPQNPHSLQRKRKADENTEPAKKKKKKRHGNRLLGDQPAVVKASTSAAALGDTKTNPISSPEPQNAPDASERLLPPTKTLSKAEIQRLIKEEVLAALRQIDHKMEELIKRTQRVESVPRYDAAMVRLQKDTRKIKRREQIALTYMRRPRPADPPAEPCRTPTPHCQPLSFTDSPVCILDPPSPAPSESRATGSPAHISRVNAEGDGAQSREPARVEAAVFFQSCLPPLDVDETDDDEVVFCGVKLPRKRIVKSFWQRRLKRKVVDLTEEEETAADVGPNSSGNRNPDQSQNYDSDCTQNGDPDSTQNGDPDRIQNGDPNRSQDQDRPASADPAATDTNTTSQGAVTPCPQTDQRQPATADPPDSAPCPNQDDDWRSRLPPLPPTPSPPSDVPASAAALALPQQLALTVGRIKNPRGIGALWNLAPGPDPPGPDDPDPPAAAAAAAAAAVSCYHIYALQEKADGRLSPWESLGVVSPLPLPMACQLTEHGRGRRICFAVVAEDVHGRFGPFSRVQSVGPRD